MQLQKKENDFQKIWILNDKDLENYDKSNILMSKNNSILNSLLSLLVVFVIGYLGIVLIHNFFKYLG